MLRKPSTFQYQVTLKAHLHLDIKNQRNQTYVLTIAVLQTAVCNAGRKMHLSSAAAFSLEKSKPKAEKEEKGMDDKGTRTELLPIKHP